MHLIVSPVLCHASLHVHADRVCESSTGPILDHQAYKVTKGLSVTLPRWRPCPAKGGCRLVCVALTATCHDWCVDYTRMILESAEHTPLIDTSNLATRIRVRQRVRSSFWRLLHTYTAFQFHMLRPGIRVQILRGHCLSNVPPLTSVRPFARLQLEPVNVRSRLDSQGLLVGVRWATRSTELPSWLRSQIHNTGFAPPLAAMYLLGRSC